MFKYFHKNVTINRIIILLNIDHGMNRYPTLSFKYKIDGDILKIELPSKHQYTLSFFEKPVNIEFNVKTKELIINLDSDVLYRSKKLTKHLENCFLFLTQRNEYITFVNNERKKMSHLVDPIHRKYNQHNTDKDGSVYRDFIHASVSDDDDDRHSSSSSSSSRDD